MPVINTAVDFAESYGEGVQGVGYQGGQPGARWRYFDTDGKIDWCSSKWCGWSPQRRNPFLSSSIKWIQDHIKGISSSKPANLEETEKPVEEKPKEDKPKEEKPATAKPETIFKGSHSLNG